MAYETGTAANITELIDQRLKNFMVAQGWTLNSDNFPDLLALSKDGCFVNFRFDGAVSTNITIQNNGVQNLTDAFGVAREDRKLWAHLANGYNASPATWEAQPGSPVDSTGINEPFVQVNDLLGPFPSYHIFSGDESAGDPAYIYMAIETRAGFYSHLIFGNVDKTGLSYTPSAAFLTGTRYPWWPNSTAVGSRDDLQWADNNVRLPFQTTSFARPQYHIAPGGADPGTDVRPLPANNRGNVPMVQPFATSALRNQPLIDWDSVNGDQNGFLHNATLFRGRVGVSAVTPLLPVPIIMASIPDADVSQFVGQAANLRICSMFDLSPGQQISFGDENWLVFPARQQQNKGTLDAEDVPASPGLINTSFQYGLAYKLVA